jgi:O-antigen/teichoic acid export membrane protein
MEFSLKALMKNRAILFSLTSQLVSLGVSILMTLGVTRYLSIDVYGYWQLFIFYSSYIGFAHLGLCDGLYLRYGGQSFAEISKSEVKSFFTLFLLKQILFSIFSLLIGYYLVSDVVRQNIFLYISVLLLVANSQIFLGFILLSTNKIVEYSTSVFLDKAVLLVLILIQILCNKVTLDNLIVSYIVSKIISVVYLTFFYIPFIKAKFLWDRQIFKSVLQSGFILMLSNIVSTLVIGAARYFIDMEWDIGTFGKVSLAVSLVYFVLLLLSQLSYILFPLLRKNSEENQVIIFNKINYILSFLLKFAILLYIPLMIVLKYLLPQYIDSINYILLLLPLCLFDGKMQILYSSFFKNLFLQKELLYINTFCMVVCVFISVLGAFAYKSLEIIIVGISLSIMLRSIIAEYILMKKLNSVRYTNTLIDVIFSLILVLCYFWGVNISVCVFLIVILLISYKFKYAITK